MNTLFTILSWILLIIYQSNSGTGQPLEMPEKYFSINILHTNDMHARFEQTSAFSTRCTSIDERENKCYGGFARIATLVRNAKKSSKPTLFLNAGDTYQGSIWFTVHKWRIVSRFLNLLSPDAVSLGNHEFDNGPVGLAPYLRNATYPVVTANLDLSEEPELATSPLLNSTILTVAGRKIGVIGYLTPTTSLTTDTGKVKFLDEIESIRQEVTRLRALGVKILIALGHSGFLMDKKIAKEVEGIDLVIGGHTNTFLYTGSQPDIETPNGLYPVEIQQANGRKVYVVQAYAYTKYLGNLTINFDSEGEIKKIEGNPILLDSKVTQAPDILEELEIWRSSMSKELQKVVGATRVHLEGDIKCRYEECNLGNLITDAMIDYNVKEFPDPEFWTDAAIAIINGGNIRASIEKIDNGKITKSDVLSVLPFDNYLVKVQVNGTDFRQALERSVHRVVKNDTSDLYAGFLQFSGVRVTYDLSRPAGSRVSKVKVRCAHCSIPTFSDLEDDKTYTILMENFLTAEGDGYDEFKKFQPISLGVTSDQVLLNYLKNKSPVYTSVEGRITYII